MKKAKELLFFLFALVILTSFGITKIIAAEITTDGGGDMTSAVELDSNIEYVGSVDEANEEDWYKFTTVGKDAFYNLELQSYTGIRKTAYLYTKYEKQLGYVDVGTNSDVLSVKLESNTTYYVKVVPDSAGMVWVKNEECVGNYGLKISYSVDDVGDTYETAACIEKNKKYNSNIGGEEDVDCFYFIADQTGTYEICLQAINGKNTYAQIVDDEYNFLTNFGTAGISGGSNSVREVELVKGKKYHIQVKEYYWKKTSEYAITIKKQGEESPATPASPTQGGGYVQSETQNIIMFSDVPVNVSYASAVKDMVNANVIKGFPNGTFQPNGTLTRAEAAVIVCRLKGYFDLPKAKTKFTDVTSAYDWASGYIAKATELGVINGMTPTTYAPGDKLTLDQFAKMVLCLYEDMYKVCYPGISFPSKYPEDYRNYAKKVNLFSGTNGIGEYTSYISRANACVIANNARMSYKSTPRI
ncbi:MAG: S-layer homology domain-containing protein [Ruminococcaceae bacterium]|nr:S-layer homology domain-containing protein [Oscillospiraceae bacterium]